MAEVVQKIIGKICPIRESERGPADTRRERLCTDACAAFYVYHANEKNSICSEKDAARTYQACRMWPGE